MGWGDSGCGGVKGDGVSLGEACLGALEGA